MNHTVDAEPEADIDPNMDKPEFAEMKSKPQFEVEIVRGKSNLSFTCSFIADAGQQGTGESYGKDVSKLSEMASILLKHFISHRVLTLCRLRCFVFLMITRSQRIVNFLVDFRFLTKHKYNFVP